MGLTARSLARAGRSVGVGLAAVLLVSCAGLPTLVPDLARRHAFVSGPPRLIADLAPALRGARGVTTDAFAGY